jgi:hypothetical protein
MPSIRHTDHGPAAKTCWSCHTTHRFGIECPPVNRWLVTGATNTGRPVLRLVTDLEK